MRDSVRLRTLDLRDRVSGRADRLVPPRRLGFAGHADFVATGDELLSHAIALAGLQPGDAVLDVGCGTGRFARPLAGYLDARGSYDGFDADREAIGWCRRRYRPIPNFRFHVADVYDRRSNPQGTHTAADYPFPHETAHVDVVLLVSVLTHLLEAEAEHHLAEAARVLRPGGRILATCFILDAESRAAIAEGRSGLEFLDPDNHVAVMSEDLPEEAVAYDERWMRERLGACGLRPCEPIHRGTWSGREDGLWFEDIVVAERA
jgi:SAM-dependent methyltransferase